MVEVAIALGTQAVCGFLKQEEFEFEGGEYAETHLAGPLQLAQKLVARRFLPELPLEVGDPDPRFRAEGPLPECLRVYSAWTVEIGIGVIPGAFSRVPGVDDVAEAVALRCEFQRLGRIDELVAEDG